MKKIFQPAFDFLLFSNVFMALCAVAQGLVTFYLIGAKPVEAVIGLLFTSTLGIYNFSILFPGEKDAEHSPHKRVRWFFSHYRLMVTLTIVSLLSLIPLFFLISIESRILLTFLAVLSFAYSIGNLQREKPLNSFENVLRAERKSDPLHVRFHDLYCVHAYYLAVGV